MTNKNKTIALVMGMLILGLLMISLASADSQVCFSKGDKYKYCSPTYQQNVCGSALCSCTTTTCMVCMKTYDPVGKCYYAGSWPRCTVGCSNPGNGTTNGSFDLTPPVFKILSPLNSTISNNKKLFLNFSLNEIATVYYKDMNKNSNTWIKVCDNCAVGNPSYAKTRSFNEGENNLMFKAIDLKDNTAYASVKFFVDSTSPRIYTTLPKANTFADGNFEVQFLEKNPKKLTLTYGTDKVDLNLSKCQDGTSGKKICDLKVDLSKYNGKKIGYYFELEDIAGNKYKSKPYNVSVDTKAPVINNPSSFFKVNGNYVDFNISITEDNLYKVTFTKTNSQTTTQTTLCTKLVNGRCEKHQGFSKGTYSLSLQVTDKAGHSIAIPANFNMA